MTEQVDALSPAGVSELATFIIRPPRAHYSTSDLGDRVLLVDRVPACRTDLHLRNARDQTLQASHFKPVAAPPDAPVVVYLHGNGSCRVEATTLLHYVIPYGLSLFAFDFSGSGRSEGEYISLGVNEKHDVETVVDHLVNECAVSRIVLWGHSMGAATAVMYAGLCKRSPQIRALVLDSPFASFDKLAQSMVADMPIPSAVPRKLILSVGVRAVRKAVRERAAFDVNDIDPLSAAKKINYPLPALFLHGTADAVVPLTHGQQLHKTFPASEKHLIVMQSLEHDTPRPEWVMDRIHVFLQKHLREEGTDDILYLDYLKGRGNAAMLSGRFEDSVHVYSQALNALASHSIGLAHMRHLDGRHTRSKFHPHDVDEDFQYHVVRRHSSISNFVNSVKRWRSSCVPLSGDENNFRAPRHHPKVSEQHRHRQAAAENARHTSGPVPNDLMDFNETPASSRDSNAANELHSLHSSPLVDDKRSDGAGSSGRFSKTGLTRSWHANSFIASLKKKMNFSWHGSASSTQSPTSQGVTSRPDGTEKDSADRREPDGRRNSKSLSQDGESQHRPSSKSEERQARKGSRSRSSSTGRLSRSSSRVRIGHRSKRRESVLRANAPSGQDHGSGHRMWYSPDEMKRRMKTPDLSSLKSRFSNGDTVTRGAEVDSLGRVPSDERTTASFDTKSWKLDDERKALALALLGNRSLARRRAKDVNGALADAMTSIDLDPSWVRGYVRKAAALREIGDLRQARVCVVEGLRQDPEHAGLTDMLQSVDIALEAEKLAHERKQVQRTEESEADVNALSGQA
ncbi:unnamed protein product [Chondrus crispus]|uniref:Serine aminopeptidase S33 domain-containing protein n=1 Tax=Chondrus crispus TaxID=2769 RepID=R7QAB8_CHOCR|nr:unnamed protein product [Chondrus crispus]CDF34415.1 unnamed protein product [Chondrus crispus]|eukprot:XP_005714234.1 unnamed protein product [Chondrus crispus]